MKPYVNTITPNKLSLQEFDAYMADGYFPVGQSLQALSHLVVQIMWILEVNRVYRMRFSANEIVMHKSHHKINKRKKGKKSFGLLFCCLFLWEIKKHTSQNRNKENRNSQN